MNIDERNQSSRGYKQFRSTLHIGIGGLYIALGLFILMIRKFGAVELSAGAAYPLGAILVLYGGFRIWRGITDLRNLPKRDINRDFPSLRKDEPGNLQ
jgi:hypothetical protein